MNPKILKGIIAVVIIGIAFMLLKSFLGTPSSSTLKVDPNSVKFVDDRNMVITLNRLEKVKLDESIFSNTIFLSLVNFERPITDEPIGRPNPFAPIGNDGIAPPRPIATSTIVR